MRGNNLPNYRLIRLISKRVIYSCNFYFCNKGLDISKFKLFFPVKNLSAQWFA